MKKHLFPLLFLVPLLLWTVPASAQVSSALTVSPVIFNVTLSPGKLHEYSVTIKNGLDAPVPLQISVENLDISRQDEIKTTALPSIASWVSLPETNMIIEPKGERTVFFTVRVPDRVPLGGYYGMIYLHPFSPGIQSPREVTSKIGILLLGSVGVQEIPLNKIEIPSARFSRLMYDTPETELQFAVKNNALNHVSAKPFLRIRPLFGKSQDVSLEEKLIFPGRTRTWNIPLKLATFPGIWYTADLMVSVGGGVQKKTSLAFVAFPYASALLWLGVILAAGLVVQYRKRLIKAVRVFLKG